MLGINDFFLIGIARLNSQYGGWSYNKKKYKKIKSYSKSV